MVPVCKLCELLNLQIGKHGADTSDEISEKDIEELLKLRSKIDGETIGDKIAAIQLSSSSEEEIVEGKKSKKRPIGLVRILVRIREMDKDPSNKKLLESILSSKNKKIEDSEELEQAKMLMLAIAHDLADHRLVA